MNELQNFKKISETENLLSEKIIANNDNLDIYRNRMELKERYLSILKKYVVTDNELERRKKQGIKKGKKDIVVSEIMFQAIQDCSTWFRYEMTSGFTDMKVQRANRCHHKYCPQCARIQALRRTMQATYLMQELEKDGYTFIFLTLTTKNYDEQELEEKMLEMNKALNQRFLKYKLLKQAFHGCIRKFELTYNPYVYKNGRQIRKNGKPVIDPNKKPFNAHIHMIVAVKKSYFGRNYITQATLRELWQKALNVDYLPQVNAKRVKLPKIENIEQTHAEYDEKREELSRQNFINGALEIGKYVAKASDYLISDEMFAIFYETLFKKRNWTMSGVFKNKKKELEQQDIDIDQELLYKDLEFNYIADYNYNNFDNNFYMTRLSQKDNEKEKAFDEILDKLLEENKEVK